MPNLGGTNQGTGVAASRIIMRIEGGRLVSRVLFLGSSRGQGCGMMGSNLTQPAVYLPPLLPFQKKDVQTAEEEA